MTSNRLSCGVCRLDTVVETVIPLYKTELEHDGRNYAIEIADFHVRQCTNCHAIASDDETEEALSTALRDKAGLLHPAQIHARRIKLGLKQSDISEATGISSQTLSRWENGAQIQKICMDIFLRAFFDLAELRRYLKAPQSSWGFAYPPVVAGHGGRVAWETVQFPFAFDPKLMDGIQEALTANEPNPDEAAERTPSLKLVA